MATKQRLYDVDDVWDLYCLPENDRKRFELIDGAISEMSGPGGTRGRIVIRLGRHLDIFVEENGLGYVTPETGHHPHGNRHTLLLPDVAFVSRGRAPDPFPEKFVPVMPDLAVEIKSPSNTVSELREKAQLYFRHGTKLVWLVMPATQTVEVHRPEADMQTLSLTDSLSGGAVLPGFHLPLQALFA